MEARTIDERLQNLDKAIEEQKKDLTAAVQVPGGDLPWWSTTNAMTMSSIVLVFGVVVLTLAFFLIKAGISGEAVLRIFGTILIVFLAVFLVVAGYSDLQMAPVMGLLGTIAGYLLGKEAKVP
jgi:VIT1/CCC1 family predicted Fe2+/Mn2+ transporter